MRFHSETQFVQWLTCRTPQRGRGLVLGIGDDAAVVRAGPEKDWILTTDLSIEGVHFQRALHPADSVGHRALARSLSDVAAMGGVPRFALVSLAISQETPAQWLNAFYRGLLRLARRFGVKIVGGDTAVVSNQITIDAILVGEVARGQALLRSGARPGDQVYVSGRLGLSALGLSLLQSEGRRPPTWVRSALRAHLYPEPQCALGRFLSRRQLASAVIDISDGLSTDLTRLCQASGVGTEILASMIPVATLGHRKPPPDLNTMQLALHGGEDYQLLFTVSPDRLASIPRKFHGVPLHRIGEIQRTKQIMLVRADGTRSRLLPQGFDHFRRSLSSNTAQ